MLYRVRKAIRYVEIRVKNLVILMSDRSLTVGNTYYPEKNGHKTRTEVFFDQLRWIMKYGYVNHYYFLFGFDIKGFRDQSQYVDYYGEFYPIRNSLNMSPRSHFLILRDKSLFGVFAQSFGFATPRNVGIFQNGTFYDYESRKRLPISEFITNDSIMKRTDGGGYFLKEIDSECADGVYRIFIKEGKTYYNGNAINIHDLVEKGSRILLQCAVINQHPAISAIFPNAINTIRLVTVHNSETHDIEVFGCLLRVGTKNSSVDNWAAGGLIIGINIEDACLLKEGYFKPGYGTRVYEHPDTHIKFEGYRIPYLKEAISEAKEFHRMLYGLHSIGWDIGITEEGPIFIEGNENWEITIHQVCDHGLRVEFDRVFK